MAIFDTIDTGNFMRYIEIEDLKICYHSHKYVSGCMKPLRRNRQCTCKKGIYSIFSLLG